MKVEYPPHLFLQRGAIRSITVIGWRVRRGCEVPREGGQGGREEGRFPLTLHFAQAALEVNDKNWTGVWSCFVD